MILFVCKYTQQKASSRYRGYNWANFLRKNSYKAICINHYDKFQKKIKISFYIKIFFYALFCNKIVFQKYIPSNAIQLHLKFLQFFFQKRIIFDFDDRIYSHRELQSRRSRFSKCLHLADAIIVSVPNLYQEISMAYPAIKEKITIIPSLINLAQFKGKQSDKDTSTVCISWIGTREGIRYLHEIEDVFVKLVAEFGNTIKFKIISDADFIPSKPLPVQNIRWRLEDELKYFYMSDISIMPLSSSKRAQCKASFKAIQSLAAGTPVVASGVGFNNEVIQHAKNGFLAQTNSEFYSFLKKLILNPELRTKLGEQGKIDMKVFDYSHWKKPYFAALGFKK